MPLPQSSLNPMCTYPDVLLYIPSFPCFRVARILKQFGITPPRGVRREAAECRRRRRDEEAYMEGVRREHLGSAYMEEPRRSHKDTVEEMEVVAVGVRGGR